MTTEEAAALKAAIKQRVDAAPVLTPKRRELLSRIIGNRIRKESADGQR